MRIKNRLSRSSRRLRAPLFASFHAPVEAETPQAHSMVQVRHSSLQFEPWHGGVWTAKDSKTPRMQKLSKSGRWDVKFEIHAGFQEAVFCSHCVQSISESHSLKMAAPAGNVENGEKLFKGRCAQCHTVNSGGTKGANLPGKL